MNLEADEFACWLFEVHAGMENESHLLLRKQHPQYLHHRSSPSSPTIMVLLAATNCRQTHDKESHIRILDSVMTYPWHFQQQFWTLCNGGFPKSTKWLYHCPLSAMESGFGCHAARGWWWCAMLSWFFVLLLVVSKVKKKVGKVKQDWRKWRKYPQNMTTGKWCLWKCLWGCQKGHPACAKVSWKAPSNCESCYVFFAPTYLYLYTAFVEIDYLMTSYNFTCLEFYAFSKSTSRTILALQD